MIHNQAETLGEFRSTRKHRRDGILEPVGWDVLSALHSFFAKGCFEGTRLPILVARIPAAVRPESVVQDPCWEMDRVKLPWFAASRSCLEDPNWSSMAADREQTDNDHDSG